MNPQHFGSDRQTSGSDPDEFGNPPGSLLVDISALVEFALSEHILLRVKDTSYSAAYMSQTRDQQRFTISEVALIGMSQWCRSALCGHPLPSLTDNWTHGAASRHTVAPISHTRPLPCSRSYYSFPVLLRVGG